MALVDLIQTSKLFRFLIVFSFFAGLYLVVSLLVHLTHGGEIRWDHILILGLSGGVVYALLPPRWSTPKSQ